MGKPYVEFFQQHRMAGNPQDAESRFAPRFFSDEVTCDIQFGNIKGPQKMIHLWKKRNSRYVPINGWTYPKTAMA